MQDREFLERVKDLAYSDAFEELLNRLEDQHVADWKSTAPVSNEMREHHWRMIVAINALREEIKNVIQGNLVSQHNRNLRGRKV